MVRFKVKYLLSFFYAAGIFLILSNIRKNTYTFILGVSVAILFFILWIIAFQKIEEKNNQKESGLSFKKRRQDSPAR